MAKTLDDPMVLSRNITRLREASGDSKRALAEAIGTTPMTVLHLESKPVSKHLCNLLALAEYFQVSLTDLVDPKMKVPAYTFEEEW